MVLVTPGTEAACSAAKAMGARAEARRRRVLVNCIVGGMCDVVVVVGVCYGLILVCLFLNDPRVGLKERIELEVTNATARGRGGIKRMTLLSRKTEEVYAGREGKREKGQEVRNGK